MAEDVPRARLGDVDCNICSQLLFDPVTISCGHSYCRRCVQKALHYQAACPVCRVPCYYSGKLPVNICLRSVLETALPVETAERRRETEDEKAAALDATNRIPLFVLTAVVFPGGTTNFCIFEPRYRLMLSRVMASSRRFGLVCTRRDPENGTTSRCTVGTVLEVTKCRPLPDGRAFIECLGCERFSIVDTELVDGYYVATTQKLEDEEDEESSASNAVDEEGETSASSVSSTVSSVDAYTRRLLAEAVAGDYSSMGASVSRLAPALRELGPPPPVEEGCSRLGMWVAEHLIFVSSQRQALLEMTSPVQRLIAISSYMEEDAVLVKNAPPGACRIS